MKVGIIEYRNSKSKFREDFGLGKMPSESYKMAFSGKTRVLPDTFVDYGLRNWGLHCSGCDCRTLSKEVYDTILTSTFFAQKPAIVLAKIEEYKECLRPVERKVFKQLKQMHRLNPSENLQELTKRLLKIHEPKLIKEQLYILDKIQKESKKLPKHLSDAVNTKLVFAKRVILKKEQGNFKRKKFVQSMNKLKNTYPEEPALETIYNLAKSLPVSEKNIGAFVVKYSRRSPEEIGDRLVNQSVASYEHIKAYSDGGETSIRNSLILCRACNNVERKNTHYNEYFAINPKMMRHTKTNLREYTNLKIDTNNEDLRNYPNYVVKAVKGESLDLEYKKANPDLRMIKKMKLFIRDLKRIARDFQRKLEVEDRKQFVA